MNNKPKLVYGIKGKLISAACMLLVAVIMVVSSTYAWFTLSTAPEVTGINTAVGANGSLEMALNTDPRNMQNITSAAGDSLKSAIERNLTWGNLVDVSDSYYGLQDIILYPSQLVTDKNAEDNTILGIESPLATPEYGADGRVTQLVEKAGFGTYTAADGEFYENDNYGVRALGVASGMTARQLAYRNARALANEAASQAKRKAALSLNLNGNALASLAMKKAVVSNPEYTQDDVTAVQAIITDLTTEGGVLDQIETAYLQLIIGFAASAKGAADDLTWNLVQSTVNAEGATLDSVLQTLSANSITLPDALIGGDGAFTKYQATVAKVTQAQTNVNALKSLGTITWEAGTDTAVNPGLGPTLALLADVDKMLVNGFEAKRDNMDAIINTVSQGVTVTITSGGGVYADIADHCGDYTAPVTISGVSAGNFTLNNFAAKMATKSNVSVSYLSAMSKAVETAGAPTGTTGEALPFSEMYGYVVDLAFRTNAAGSNLLLQTEAVDRIYSDNDNSETMGHGSSMTFTSTHKDFTNTQVVELMKEIRIVFFDPITEEIFAYARMDLSEDATAGTKAYVVTDAGVTANIYLCEADGTFKTGDTAAQIVALQQNVAKAVSVLVYLDGTNIQNADVSIGASSMRGTMNLQFASDATLTPMEYGDIHTPGTNAGN